MIKLFRIDERLIHGQIAIKWSRHTGVDSIVVANNNAAANTMIQKSLNDALDAFFQTVGEKDQVILLSDMYGGSVNSTMYTYLDRPNTILVAGVNLALVIGLTILEGDITRETLESVIEQSREAIRIVDLEKSGEEEEDELF